VLNGGITKAYYATDLHDFNSVEHAQTLATKWLWTYNNERPNTAVGGIPPATVQLAA